MGLLTCNGSIDEGPATQQDGQFPSGVTHVPFTLATGATPKNANVSTGAKVRQVNSPSSFVILSGVGAGDDVTQASFAYVRVATGSFQVRVTYHNPAGSPIVSVLPTSGLTILEPDAANGFYVTQVEVMGSGTVEFYAAGAQ